MATESVDTLFERYGPSYRWLVTTTGMMGSMVMILASTMANVAVPSIMGTFGVGQDQAQWMASAFLATMTASQLLGAWIMAAMGARAGYLAAVAIFFVGSLICAGAPTIDILIFGRVVQGFAAGAVQPVTMVVIFKAYPPDQRGLAMSLYAMGIMIAPIMGPVVGGITIDWLSWRHVFFIPLPVAGIAMLMAILFMPTKDPSVKRPPLDWQGYILVGMAIVCLMVAIANGQRDGWVSDKIVGLLVVGGGLATAFVISQYRSPAPILNFAVFKYPQFVIAAILGFVFGAGNFGSTYIIPVFVQTVQDFTPTAAGMVTVPAGIVVMCLYPIMGRLVDTFPIRYLAMTGLALFAFGMILFETTDVNTTFWTLAIFTIIGRLGFSIMIPAINVSALNALPPEQLDQGAGTINFIRLLGGAFGVNSLVVFMEQRTEFHSIALTATQTSHNSASRELLDQVTDLLQMSGVAEAFHQPGALHFLGRIIEAQANTLGFKDGFMVLSVIFILALVPAWRMGSSRRR